MKKKFFLFLTWCHMIMAAKPPAIQHVDIVLNEIHTENFAKNIVTLLDVRLVTWQGRKVLTGVFNYNQVIPNMHLRFTLSFEKPDKTRMEMMDLMLSVCDYLNGSYDKLKIPRIVLHELRKQKGIPKQCPIEANTNYTLENYSFDIPQFPLPNLKFIAACTLYRSDKKTKILRISVKGATKRSRN
ncbi:hypothetical protein DOY81_007157 [Sarcophaga bullata]|nr:hypothetical protein DOY81_007157 [Sarcophaga bullata]